MLNLIALGAAVWTAVILVVIALCRAAAQADDRLRSRGVASSRNTPRRGLVAPRDGALHGL